MTLIEDLRYQRGLLVKQVFESELTIVKQYLLGIVEAIVTGKQIGRAHV